MSYKDTNQIQKCPYNGFSECFYESCPFFAKTEETKKHFLGYSDDLYHHEEYRYEIIIHIGCKKAQAEIRASEQSVNNNVNVNVDNKVASRASIF